jgi:hypothetical protein
MIELALVDTKYQMDNVQTFYSTLWRLATGVWSKRCGLIEITAYMTIAPEKAVVFVGTGSVFQSVFLTHGKHIQIIYIQDTPQIGVSGKYQSKKVVFLSFHPVGCWPQGSGGRHMRIIFRNGDFHPNTDVFLPIVQVIHHTQLLSGFIGMVHAAKGGEEVELELFVVAQYLQQRDQFFPRGMDVEQPVECNV